MYAICIDLTLKEREKEKGTVLNIDSNEMIG